MAYQKRNNNYKGSRSNDSYKKHSGAKKTINKKDGSPVTTGWHYGKRFGLTTFLAVTTKNTSVHVSKAGHEWLNVMVKVSRDMQKDVLVSGLMHRMTGKVIINEMGIVINPAAPNGGFCGRYGTK